MELIRIFDELVNLGVVHVCGQALLVVLAEVAFPAGIQRILDVELSLKLLLLDLLHDQRNFSVPREYLLRRC